MKKIFLIGIGPGDPDYLTIQAIKTMNRVDVFFLFEKEGRGKGELTDIRKAMLRKYVKGRKYRVVSAPMPERDRDSAAYESAVEDWRERKRDVMAGLIENELKANQTGAFLIWGDPSLYDGSIEMLHDIRAAGGVKFDFAVVPGITCIQALTQKHRIPLNRAGESIRITTGRRLNEKARRGAENVVVMLDRHSALKKFAGKDIEVFWGGYLGTKDEVLLSGRLEDVVGDYDRIKARAGGKKGWIMDTYLLRKRKPNKRR
jgi:precorrin-6A synthase